MLLAMSAVFIVCQFLKIVPDMYELFFCQLTMDLSGHHCRMDGKVSSICCIQLVRFMNFEGICVVVNSK